MSSVFLSPELLSLSQQVGNDTERKVFACNSAVKALFFKAISLRAKN